MRPEDLDAGGMETVFPWRESDGDGTTVESHHRLSEIAMGVRNPVMLIRIKPGDMHRVVKRQGQESFNFGDLFAFTKVCSHLGCPSSLYEQQTYRILCPCHQSQFDALHFAKPIFGPAARALAQLPITIDKDGYLVANGDFIEPVGPAFWERKTIMSPKLPKPPSLNEIAASQGDAIDSRYHPSAAVRRQLNKVFPTHWSFLLGEIALYSFIVLLLTGVYLSCSSTRPWSMSPTTACISRCVASKCQKLSHPPSISASRCAAVCSSARSTTGPHCFSRRRSWSTWPASSSPARSGGPVRRTG